MRTKGTKYDKLNELTDNMLPLSTYATKNGIRNPAYVCVKYDRFKFGYKDKNGNIIFGKYPGYDIYDWNGMNVVISAK